MDALNQVDLKRLQKSKVSAVIGAIFIDPDAMITTKNDTLCYPIDAASFEL